MILDCTKYTYEQLAIRAINMKKKKPKKRIKLKINIEETMRRYLGVEKLPNSPFLKARVDALKKINGIK